MGPINGSFHNPSTPPLVSPPTVNSITLTAPTPLDLLRVAYERNASIEQLTQLIELHERWERNLARKAYFKAKAAFKAVAPEILKNVTVEFQTKPRDNKPGKTITWDFSSLDQICDCVIKKLSEFALGHDWKFEQPSKELIRVGCVLTHELGHSETTWLQGPPDYSGDKSDIHAIYSTVAHLERYTLLGAVGLATKDNPELHKATTAINGNAISGQTANMSELEKQKAQLHNAPDEPQLRKLFRGFYAKAAEAKDQHAQNELIKAKDKRLKELF